MITIVLIFLVTATATATATAIIVIVSHSFKKYYTIQGLHKMLKSYYYYYNSTDDDDDAGKVGDCCAVCYANCKTTLSLREETQTSWYGLYPDATTVFTPIVSAPG